MFLTRGKIGMIINREVEHLDEVRGG